jgi:hypothetical protein
MDINNTNTVSSDDSLDKLPDFIKQFLKLPPYDVNTKSQSSGHDSSKQSQPVFNTTFPITQSPPEIIHEILKYVPEPTVVNLGMTCKGMKEILKPEIERIKIQEEIKREKKREYRAKINWAILGLYLKSIDFIDVSVNYSIFDKDIIYNNKKYVFCINCRRKVYIDSIVKHHGIETVQEYAKDGKFYCYTCIKLDM